MTVKTCATNSNRIISLFFLIFFSNFFIIFLYDREEICCGIIFKGPSNEVVIHPRLMKPCSCRNKLNPSSSPSDPSSSPSDPSSSPSVSGNDQNSLSPTSSSPPSSVSLEKKASIGGSSSDNQSASSSPSRLEEEVEDMESNASSYTSTFICV